MRTLREPCHNISVGGFALPAILVITSAMLILAVGILCVSGIERRTARAFADRARADLAARAGLEEIRRLLMVEASNDDFIVLSSTLASPVVSGRTPAPQLCIARGKAGAKGLGFRYIPLCSAIGQVPETSELQRPEIEPFLGATDKEGIAFTTLPYQDKVRAAWLPVRGAHGRCVGRYAFWVEDLQGKLDPKLVGNLSGPEQTHARAIYPFPAPGLNPAPAADDAPPLDQVSLFALDPEASSHNQSSFARSLIRHRSIMLSPRSAMAAANIRPPLARDGLSGRLSDGRARAAEENLIVNLQPYWERPLIPWVPGISIGYCGSPRVNLNALLDKAPDVAVDEMAGMIREALPVFEQRKGGFPEDYVRTLAANALDYADADSNPTLKAGAYRGLDAYPLMSEIALQVNYLGISTANDRKIMSFRFKLFAELVNLTNQPVTGAARLSYEVSLPMDGIGSGIGGEPFDAPSLLSNEEVSTHDLTRMDDRYWSREIPVALQPNQYQCYCFADVSYRIDVGAASDPIPNETPFSLNESRGASGVSLMWNGGVVDRVASVLRQAGLIYSTHHGVVTGGFKVGTPDTLTKAALPGHVYDDYPNMYYNMGDPRITHYLRSAALDENAYPENASPNRRNVRLDIYKNDAAAKPKVYARVLPSEWPDGGHNAPVGTWSPGTSDATEMTDARFHFPYDPQTGPAAVQQLSNRGRFYSATELGRVFDPIMHAPTFSNNDVSVSFRSKGKLPAGSDGWPDVSSSQGGPFYGGGHTLRIGRPEHAAFARSSDPGMHAVRLLDLFHAGLSRSEDPSEREGPVTRIMGHVNINTASRDVLRALAAGLLVMDPLLARREKDEHLGAPAMAAPTTPLALAAPSTSEEADRIADAIIRCRPFASTADLALVSESDGTLVFGNRSLYQDDKRIEWSDAAAEEIFARVYEAATVRSRNFRVWIVGQALAPAPVNGGAPQVLAQVRKVYTLFADPGERAADGSVIPSNAKTIITSSNDF